VTARERRAIRRRCRWAALVAASLMAGCGNGEGRRGGDARTAAAAETPPTAVEVWTVRAEPLTTRRRWAGTLEPLISAAVRAPRQGQVISVPVRDGDGVRPGDVLVRLGAPELLARRAVLQERHRHLQEELQRWTALAEARAAGPAEVNQASLRLLEVREALAEIEATLAAYVVRSPAAGQVLGTAITAGAHVSEGQVLMRVDDVATLGVRLAVPAGEATLLERPAALRVLDGGLDIPVERVVRGRSERPGFVNAEIYVRGVTDARPREVEVVYETAEEVLVVPWTAVASEQDARWVALLTGEPPQLVRQRVDLGRAHPAGIEVLGGLSAGDRVVRYEPRSHPEGRRVEPREAAR
jgi:multidrug efflux pump subunit AcrA (membrane-fusion protein)